MHARDFSDMFKKNIFDMVVKTVAATTVLSVVSAADTSKARKFPLIQQDLFFNRAVGAYRQQFKQDVLQVTNKDIFKVSFGLGEDLFSNSSVPKLIKMDLLFKRNTFGGREVTESQFQTFVDSAITPRFPNRPTIFNANGQFLNSTGTIIEESSKVVSLILEDTWENETSVNQIVKEYIQLFHQESVLTVVDENINVRFVEAEAVPEPEIFSVAGILLFSTSIVLWRLKKKVSGIVQLKEDRNPHINLSQKLSLPQQH